MSEKLATIISIKDLTSIPEADKIVLASMNENSWKCVCKKDEFKIGDKAIYICIDSIVDNENPYFSFMEPRKFHVWNAKFRKVPSQGLLVPLSVISYYNVNLNNFNIDDDVTEIIKVTKYEKVLDVKLQGEARGGLPTALGFRKTDETNLLSCRKGILDELLDKEICWTVKRDGSSGGFVINNGDFQACSRSLSMKEGNGYPWLIADKFGIKDKLINFGGNWIIQGECTGPKFNGNRLGLNDLQFHIFNIKNIDENRCLGLLEMQDFCSKIGIPMVDVIGIEKFDTAKHTVEYFQNIANNLKYPNNSPAEGIVIRSTIPFYSVYLEKEWSVKIINQNYKE